MLVLARAYWRKHLCPRLKAPRFPKPCRTQVTFYVQGETLHNEA